MPRVRALRLSQALRPRPTLAIVASAGDYSDGPSWGRPDLATPYLQAALRFIGLGEIAVLGQGPTIGPEPAIAAARDKARARLSQLAESFAAALPQAQVSAARAS